MRQKKNLKRTVLIYCEGESESIYFKHLEEKLIELIGRTSVPILDVHPVPPEENDVPSLIQKQKEKRKLKNNGPDALNPEEITAWEVITGKKYTELKKGEKATWPQPAKYVKLARDKILETEPREAWVVFDSDGHPKVKEAFDFARKAVKVNESGDEITISVAFSKLSFEYWKLLHFEFAAEKFNYTQHHTTTPPMVHQWPRRNGQRVGVLVPCGENTPEAEGFDCKGLSSFSSTQYLNGNGPCLVGRIVQKNYLQGYQKGRKSSDFAILFPLLKTAIARAEILRSKLRIEFGDLEPYEYPFYTNLDELVLSIAAGYPDLMASKEVLYFTKSSPEKTKSGIEIKAESKKGQLTFEIINHSPNPILRNEFICFFPESCRAIVNPSGHSLIRVGETAQLVFPMPEENELVLFKFKDTLFGVDINLLRSFTV